VAYVVQLVLPAVRNLSILSYSRIFLEFSGSRWRGSDGACANCDFSQTYNTAKCTTRIAKGKALAQGGSSDFSGSDFNLWRC